MPHARQVDPPDLPWLYVAEKVFIAIFTAEMLVKMLAYGVFGHSHAYLHDSWCQVSMPVVHCLHSNAPGSEVQRRI